MTTIINADNGVSSGSAGLKSTADSSGVLALQSSGSTAFTVNTDLTTAFTTTLRETPNVTATAMNTSLNFDVITQSILYYTSNATANATINFRGNSTTSLNTMMTIGQSISVVFMNTNGATPYYLTAFTIDGTSVTPKWQGGTAPTSGNASGIDAYVFTIIKTASATYTVLASQTQFK
jgi:hypothetical protein